jgi:hypothetical protein
MEVRLDRHAEVRQVRGKRLEELEDRRRERRTLHADRHEQAALECARRDAVRDLEGEVARDQQADVRQIEAQLGATRQTTGGQRADERQIGRLDATHVVDRRRILADELESDLISALGQRGHARHGLGRGPGHDVPADGRPEQRLQARLTADLIGERGPGREAAQTARDHRTGAIHGQSILSA